MSLENSTVIIPVWVIETIAASRLVSVPFNTILADDLIPYFFRLLEEDICFIYEFKIEIFFIRVRFRRGI